MKRWMIKNLFLAWMAACLVPLQGYAVTTVVPDVTTNLITILNNSGVTVTSSSVVTLSGTQAGQVNAPLNLGTVNITPLILPAPGIMLTTGNLAGTGGALMPPLGGAGDADIGAALVAAGYATTGIYDASSVQFSFSNVQPGTTAITMDLVFATNEVIGATSPDTVVIMIDGVNKAVFNNGQLLSNQSAAFLFAQAPLGTIVSGYNNVSELHTITALLGPGPTHTVKIAIADNTLDTVDSAIIITNFLESTSTQEGMGVGDIFPPVVTPQADVVAPATGPTTAVNLGVPIVTDNVGVLTTTALPAGPFPPGLTVVTWSATDAAGNIGTAIQNVTITDIVPPTVTAPANATFVGLTAAGTPAGDPGIVAWLASAVVTDLTGPPTLVNDAPPVFPLGQTLVTFTATDLAGNIATAAATVTISNQTPAVMVGPANLVVTATSAAGIPAAAFVIGNFLNSATAVDDIDGVITPLITNNAPVTFPIGTTTVTFSVTNSGGIVSTIQANVTVNPQAVPPVLPSTDQLPPVIKLNGSPQVTILQNVAYVDAGAIAVDNVDGPVTAAIVTTNPVNVTIPGVYIVSYSVADAAGNISTMTRAVQVVGAVIGLDVLPPVVTSPLDIMLPAIDFQGVPSADARVQAFLAGATAVDNLGVLGAVVNDVPAQLQVGKTLVTFTAFDATGNTGMNTAMITVVGTNYAGPVADLDGDGLPDGWEITNFGDLLTASAATDFDGDGLLEIDELALGTNPALANTNTTTVANDFGDVVYLNSPSDTDGDSVIDALENWVDLLNPGIASGIPSANMATTLTVDANANVLRNVSVSPVNPATAPATINSAFGILSYSVQTAVGATVTVRVTSAAPLFGGNTQFYKVDAAGIYHLITTGNISIISASVIDITLTDGGPLDLDNIANGVIVDPIAFGVAPQVLGGSGAGSGGCSINPTAGFDPMLLLLLLLSMVYLIRQKLNIGKI